MLFVPRDILIIIADNGNEFVTVIKGISAIVLLTYHVIKCMPSSAYHYIAIINLTFIIIKLFLHINKQYYMLSL